MYSIIIISFRKIHPFVLDYSTKKNKQEVEEVEFPGLLKK